MTIDCRRPYSSLGCHVLVGGGHHRGDEWRQVLPHLETGASPSPRLPGAAPGTIYSSPGTSITRQTAKMKPIRRATVLDEKLRI